MLKRRVEAMEKRLAGLGGMRQKNFRIVYQFDGDPEPKAGPDEELFIVRVVNTRGEKIEAQEGKKSGN
jgi:hypothetical protein